jgi:exonuclease III
MAFRKKAEFILEEQPDILIVPECENQQRLSFSLYTKQPTNVFWYGNLPTKGIGVFTYNDFKIKPLEIHNPDFQFVIPLSIYNNKIVLTVLAVWTQQTERHYTEQIWDAIHYYSSLLQTENVIIAGDFNSSVIFDKPNRISNHSTIVDFLKAKNIISAYHYFYNQKQGEEKESTLFLQRKREKPFHIDFCFVSSNLIEKLKNVEIGEYDTWVKYSDHTPLIATFDIEDDNEKR